MTGPVHRLRKRHFRERAGILARLDDRRQVRLALPLDFLRRKRRVLGDVGDQTQRRGEIARQRVDAQHGRIAPGLGRVAGAELLDFLRDLDGIARRRAFLEHPGREIRCAGQRRIIGTQACVDDELRADDR